jgi:hypothetical protein
MTMPAPQAPSPTTLPQDLNTYRNIQNANNDTPKGAKPPFFHFSRFQVVQLQDTSKAIPITSFYEIPTPHTTFSEDNTIGRYAGKVSQDRHNSEIDQKLSASNLQSRSLQHST